MSHLSYNAVQLISPEIFENTIANRKFKNFKRWIHHEVFSRIQSTDMVSLLKKTRHIRVVKCLDPHSVKKGYCPITGYTKPLEYNIYARGFRAKYRCSRDGYKIISRMIELKRLVHTLRQSPEVTQTHYDQWTRLIITISKMTNEKIRIRPIIK